MIDDSAGFNVPLNTLQVTPATSFYVSNDPTNSVKALKEVVVLRIRLQSHTKYIRTQNKQLSYRRGTARRLKSVEILSAAAKLYEKSHLTRRIALPCGIEISPVGSLD